MKPLVENKRSLRK